PPRADERARPDERIRAVAAQVGHGRGFLSPAVGKVAEADERAAGERAGVERGGRRRRGGARPARGGGSARRSGPRIVAGAAAAGERRERQQPGQDPSCTHPLPRRPAAHASTERGAARSPPIPSLDGTKLPVATARIRPTGGLDAPTRDQGESMRRPAAGARAFLQCASCRFAALYAVPFCAGLAAAGSPRAATALLGAGFWLVLTLAIEVT